MYNNFDKHAPYVIKDLNANLVDYIIHSVQELGDEPFVIQFRLLVPADADLVSRVHSSIGNYFLYLKELELRELSSMIRTSLILLMLGIMILFLAVWVTGIANTTQQVIIHVLAQGLTVAAWVSLWNALATFLVNWAPHHHNIRRYKRIAAAPILFR